MAIIDDPNRSYFLSNHRLTSSSIYSINNPPNYPKLPIITPQMNSSGKGHDRKNHPSASPKSKQPNWSHQMRHLIGILGEILAGISSNLTHEFITALTFQGQAIQDTRILCIGRD